MAETSDNYSQTDSLNQAAQVDGQPETANGQFSRMVPIAVSVSVLVFIGATAGYWWLNCSFAELFPSEAASAPIPDPIVSAALKDIQSFQKQNAAALQENAVVLQHTAGMVQQGAENLEYVRQSFTAQQTDLKKITNQLSSLLARVQLSTKCSRAADNFFHSAAKCSHPGGPNVAQENVPAAQTCRTCFDWRRSVKSVVAPKVGRRIGFDRVADVPSSLAKRSGSRRDKCLIRPGSQIYPASGS